MLNLSFKMTKIFYEIDPREVGCKSHSLSGVHAPASTHVKSLLPLCKVWENGEKLLQSHKQVFTGLVDIIWVSLLFHGVAKTGSNRIVDVNDTGISGNFGKVCFICMLTLEFRCIPVVGGDVLFFSTLPNRWIIHKRFQSFYIFYGTIVTDTLEWYIF